MAELTRIPRHVGIIMDGNGRWAKLRGKPRSYGHKKGAEVIDEIVSECFDKGIEAVSLYAFSTENWIRPKEEVNAIFGLLGLLLNSKFKKLMREKVRLIVSGDLSAIPENLRKRCEEVMALTADYTGRTLNVAVNYGSRAEIVRACNAIAQDGIKTVTEEEIEKRLYTAGLPDIDLVIRTSGEMRLSNFFLWQCAYAEFYFTDVLWPDFHANELDEALEWYSGRKRRFGGVGTSENKD